MEERLSFFGGNAMTKVKICGLTRECETEYMNRWRPDFCGFIFAGNSRRYVSRERAAVLKALLSPEIRTVGVFVNARPEAAAGPRIRRR